MSGFGCGGLWLALAPRPKRPSLFDVPRLHQPCTQETITNEPDSPLAAAADRVIALGAGSERAIAATKTYTAELLAVALLSAALADDPGDRAAVARIAGGARAGRRAGDVARPPPAGTRPPPTGTPEWLGPIVSIVACQLHALHLTQARDLDPERPQPDQGTRMT